MVTLLAVEVTQPQQIEHCSRFRSQRGLTGLNSLLIHKKNKGVQQLSGDRVRRRFFHTFLLEVQSMSKDLSERQNTLLGVSAAFIEAIILQPTLYFKNAAARGLPFTLNPAVFYRGTGASIINECQMMAVQFGITSALQKQFAHKYSFNSFEINLPLSISSEGRDCLSAALGGMLSAFFSSPVELVMIQQQVYGKSVFRTISSIVQANGVFSRSGLMRGVLPTVCRDGIYVTGMLGVTPMLQNILMKDHGYSSGPAGFYASMVGGVVASLPR